MDDDKATDNNTTDEDSLGTEKKASCVIQPPKDRIKEECLRNQLCNSNSKRKDEPDQNPLEHEETSFPSTTKMPPTMLKRGRPNGAEMTVIGLLRPKKKKLKGDTVKPFS